MPEKEFDCVRMKNEIQARIYDEYIANKDQYESFAHFVKERVEKSPWAQETLRRFKSTKPCTPNQ